MVEHADQYWDAVFGGLEAVVYGRTGTARAIARDLPVPMAGKTGTAQVFGRPGDDVEADEREHDELPEHLRNHALFAGFAPIDDPRVVVVVVAEHGGGGASVAAPAAARVIGSAVELDLLRVEEQP